MHDRPIKKGGKMDKTQVVDQSALQLAILRELNRQGVDFGRVKIRSNPKQEIHAVIEVWEEDELQPKSVKVARIANQVEKAEIDA